MVIDGKNIKKCRDEELYNTILLALNGMSLNVDFESALKNDDGSLKDLKVSSPYRKLRWAVKSGKDYVMMLINTEEDLEFCKKFQVGNWNIVSWLKKAGKYKESKQVVAYENEAFMYEEATTAGDLKFMVIPIGLWIEANREVENG